MIGKLEKLKSEIDINSEEIFIFLIELINNTMQKLEREGVILGLSGGVDSAVTAFLCVRAVGSDNVLALVMPDDDSDEKNIEDALNLIKQLKIRMKFIEITPYLKDLGIYRLFPLNRFPFTGRLKGGIVKYLNKFYKRKTGDTPFSSSILGFKNKEYASHLKNINAYYRAKHRLRMLLLYLHGELENRLVVGCANKTEYMIGFFVKYGCDDCADIMPLLTLYKTQVRKLAEYLKVPDEIVNKPPSPDIIPGIVDEEAIGIPYDKLDLILLALEKGWSDWDILRELNIGERDLDYIKGLIEKSEHMRRVLYK